MSCPYCHREGAAEPSSAPGASAPDQLPSRVVSAPAASIPAAPAASPDSPPPRNALRGARKTAGKSGWLLPGILLVLMPKCPICFAAYIALVTGISIPITAAAWLRGSLIAGCIGALVWLAIRCSLYLYRRSIH